VRVSLEPKGRIDSYEHEPCRLPRLPDLPILAHKLFRSRPWASRLSADLSVSVGTECLWFLQVNPASASSTPRLSAAFLVQPHATPVGGDVKPRSRPRSHFNTAILCTVFNSFGKLAPDIPAGLRGLRRTGDRFRPDGIPVLALADTFYADTLDPNGDFGRNYDEFPRDERKVLIVEA